MPFVTRRRLFVAGPLVVLLLLAVTLLLYSRDGGMKARAAQITPGTPRAEVEELLGRPYLGMQRSGGRGTALIWVDQFWQVSVYTDPAGLAERVECVPSDSVYRRTVGRVTGRP